MEVGHEIWIRNIGEERKTRLEETDMLGSARMITTEGQPKLDEFAEMAEDKYGDEKKGRSNHFPFCSPVKPSGE